MVTHRRHGRVWGMLLAAACLGVAAPPDAAARHLCDQPGIECRGPDVGPWAFWPSFPFPDIFPVDSEVFATEEEAIAAGTAAACNPNGGVGGATICSCSLTATAAPVPLAWAYGIERMRGPGGFGRADYVLADEPHTGNCALGIGTWQWSVPWSVYGVRTIECPAGYYPDIHDPPETCWRPDPCPVPAVKPYDPDPYPLNVDNLSDHVKQGLSCLAAATGKSHTELLSSAYRPPEYQSHLREVGTSGKTWRTTEIPPAQPAVQR